MESGTRRDVPVFVSGISNTRASLPPERVGRSRCSQRAHGADLSAAHSGFDGPGEGADLATIGLGGGQEAGLLIANQAPVASLWRPWLMD